MDHSEQSFEESKAGVVPPSEPVAPPSEGVLSQAQIERLVSNIESMAMKGKEGGENF